MSKDLERIDTTGGMSSTIDTSTGEFLITQDHRPFVEAAKRDRDLAANKSIHRDVPYKKACTIPDIVAIEIYYKYGIDIHSPEFMQNPTDVQRLIRIVKSDYPYLMSY